MDRKTIGRETEIQKDRQTENAGRCNEAKRHRENKNV